MKRGRSTCFLTIEKILAGYLSVNIGRKELIPRLQILLGGSLFGLIPIFVHFGQNISVSQLVFFRAFFGTISIFFIAYITRNRIQFVSLKKFRVILWSLILLFAITSYFYALKYIDVASATLLLSFQSVFIVIFSRFILKEPIYLHTLISTILSLVGVLLIISSGGFVLSGNAIGYLFGLCAAMFAGMNFVYPKKYLGQFDPYTQTFNQSLWQLPFTFPFIIRTTIDFSIQSIVVFIGLGLVCTALAFLFIYKGAKNTRTQYVGVLQTSEFLVPIVLAAILFKEVPSLLVLSGGLLLMAGYFLILVKSSSLERNR